MERSLKIFCIFFVLVAVALLGCSANLFADARSDAKTCRLLEDKNYFPEDPAKVVPELLKNAGEAVLDLRERKDFQIQKKSNMADLRTKGDCTSQAEIFGELRKIYPDHALIGEEKCSDGNDGIDTQGGKKRIVWILDPIDGTTNYVHGFNNFNISLALAVDGTVCYGAVYAPVYGELYYAKKGQGAYLKIGDQDAMRIHVSNVEKFKDSLWATGFKVGNQAKVDANLPLMREVLLSTHGIIRPGAAALDLARMAAGQYEGYWELFMDWWDIAAGLLLVEEAGGKTYVVYSGKPSEGSDKFEAPTSITMASNGQKDVHEHMIKILNTVKK